MTEFLECWVIWSMGKKNHELSREKVYHFAQGSFSDWFCFEKFYKYIYGHFVEIFTDHKPLLGIFGSKEGEPPVQASRPVYGNLFRVTAPSAKKLHNVSKLEIDTLLKILCIEKHIFLSDSFQKFDKKTIVIANHGHLSNSSCEMTKMIVEKYPGIQLFTASDFDVGGIYFGQSFLKKFPIAIYIGMLPNNECFLTNQIFFHPGGAPFESNSKQILKTGLKTYGYLPKSRLHANRPHERWIVEKTK